MAIDDTTANSGLDEPNSGLAEPTGSTPPKSNDGISEPVGSLANEPSDNAKPRGRGRPSGSTKRSASTGSGSVGGKSKPAEKKTSIFVDKDLLGQQLVGIHLLAASFTKQPVLAISEKEGAALAKSLIDITEHYGLTASKSVMLWIQLAGTSAMIYAPRIMHIVKAKKPTQAQSTEQAQNVPSNVTQMKFD